MAVDFYGDLWVGSKARQLRANGNSPGNIAVRQQGWWRYAVRTLELDFENGAAIDAAILLPATQLSA